jgi:hypothetical protein
MLFKVRSAAVYGIDAHLIDVEVDFSGMRQEKEYFSTVGLPDAAVRESRDRVRSAIRNSGFDLPTTSTTINLAPADLKKKALDSTSPSPSASSALMARFRLKTSVIFFSSANLASMAPSAPCRACCPSPSPRANTAF